MSILFCIFVKNIQIMKIDFKLNEKCGIYKILNIKTNMFYIGSSKNIYDRLHIHFFRLKRNKHGNKHLQNSFNKHGIENFSYEILEFCNIENQFIKEQEYITSLKPEYNKSLNVNPNFGTTLSEETKCKISKTLRLKYKNKEIFPYQQNHLWKEIFVYDIENFEFISSFKNIKSFQKEFNITGILSKDINSKIIKNKYIILNFKLTNYIDIKNYIIENYFKINNKYIIVFENNKIHYFRSNNKLFKFIKIDPKRFYKEIKINNEFVFKNYKILITKNFIKLPS